MSTESQGSEQCLMNKDFCTVACNIPQDMLTQKDSETYGHTHTVKDSEFYFLSIQYHIIFSWDIQER